MPPSLAPAPKMVLHPRLVSLTVKAASEMAPDECSWEDTVPYEDPLGFPIVS